MEFRNLAHLHRRQAERLGPLPAIRFKKHGLYHDLTWTSYLEQVDACASALLAAGINPGDRVGLLSENRPEWLIADQAILAVGAVNVPPHAPLTARQVHYQFQHTNVRLAFVSSAEQLDKLRTVRSELPELKSVITFDRAGADALSWEGFLQRGRPHLERIRREIQERQQQLGPDDLATIMYTSGTTGNPKGVMLTHGNLLWNAWATNAASPRRTDSVLLSWLPFSHIYARTVDHYLSLFAGSRLCLAESVDTLAANLAEIEPTHMASVPRFYEKVLAAVGSDPETRRAKLKAIFGSRLEWLSSGGAPLPRAIAEAFHDAGILLLQGYGLTESSPVITFNHPSAYKLATVGRAIPTVEVKLAADGEILTRGAHVMKGYWKEPEASADSIKNGWLHTGDLGSLDADGFLTITGRKKEILVLSSGKKISPNQIESLLKSEPCIDQVMVCGEGRNFLSALIVPHWENLRKALQAAGMAAAHEPAERLALDPKVKSFLAERIAKALVDVSPWERVKDFVVLVEPFSVEAGELTVSLKLRRQVILSRRCEVESRNDAAGSFVAKNRDPS